MLLQAASTNLEIKPRATITLRPDGMQVQFWGRTRALLAVARLVSGLCLLWWIGLVPAETGTSQLHAPPRRRPPRRRVPETCAGCDSLARFHLEIPAQKSFCCWAAGAENCTGIRTFLERRQLFLADPPNAVERAICYQTAPKVLRAELAQISAAQFDFPRDAPCSRFFRLESHPWGLFSTLQQSLNLLVFTRNKNMTEMRNSVELNTKTRRTHPYLY